MLTMYSEEFLESLQLTESKQLQKNQTIILKHNLSTADGTNCKQIKISSI